MFSSYAFLLCIHTCVLFWVVVVWFHRLLGYDWEVTSIHCEVERCNVFYSMDY